MTDTNDAWTQVRIEFGLMQEVDKVVQQEKVFGARKYFSRSDFVKDAVLRLLEDYHTRNKTQRKKDGEEILVTRK
jgi:metal-responsive CopG/Arc/MetJ family transcriptional regulator